MKNYPLALQIWIVIAIITIFISASLVFILPNTLRSFFTTEMYATIESAQKTIIDPDSLLNDFFLEDELSYSEDIRRVNHFIIDSKGKLVSDSKLPRNLNVKIIEEAMVQEKSSEKYMEELGDRKVFYIISKAVLKGEFANLLYSEDVFLVSYLNDSYREDLVQTLFKKLSTITLVIFLFSWIPSIALAKYLSNPIVQLEKKVAKLTDRQWEEEIQLQRKDEIGRLADSIEKLRQELIRQDQAEQSFLQNISHELKTPTMVIRSYSQAIKDGIFDDLSEAIDIIDEESKRLEDRIASLLYITKLDYIANYQLNKTSFNLAELLRKNVNRTRIRRSDLSWELDLEDLSILADREQIQILIENILDNFLRYAESKIRIKLYRKDKLGYLIFYNDGPAIDEDLVESIFERFHKGKEGEIGLGLSIVQRIIQLHGYNIRVENKDKGVSFTIKFNIEEC